MLSSPVGLIARFKIVPVGCWRISFLCSDLNDNRELPSLSTFTSGLVRGISRSNISLIQITKYDCDDYGSVAARYRENRWVKRFLKKMHRFSSIGGRVEESCAICSWKNWAGLRLVYILLSLHMRRPWIMSHEGEAGTCRVSTPKGGLKATKQAGRVSTPKEVSRHTSKY